MSYLVPLALGLMVLVGLLCLWVTQGRRSVDPVSLAQLIEDDLPMRGDRRGD